ncbi:hypothetical protein RSAG8_05160, partial [Rhizoctonia solani AG-8 WAC10335]
MDLTVLQYPSAFKMFAETGEAINFYREKAHCTFPQETTKPEKGPKDKEPEDEEPEDESKKSVLSMKERARKNMNEPEQSEADEVGNKTRSPSMSKVCRQLLLGNFSLCVRLPALSPEAEEAEKSNKQGQKCRLQPAAEGV